MADRKAALQEQVSHVTRVAVAFCLVLLGLLMVVITTRQDALLFSNGTLLLPLLGAEMDYVGFYLGGPLLLVSLHIYLLAEYFRLRYRMVPTEAAEIFFPGFLLDRRDRRRLPAPVSFLLSALQHGVAASPLAVLILLQRLYLPLRLEGWAQLFFDVMLYGDLLVIIGFMVLLQWYDTRWTRAGCLGRVAWTLVLCVGTAWASQVWLSHDGDLPGNNATVRLPHWQPETLSPNLMIAVRTRNLVKADFAGAYIPAIDLRGANLEEASFQDARLRGARMGRQPDRVTVLRSANLAGADLRGADLREADLTRADLTDARLDGALLTGADLSGVRAHRASFFGADLRKVDLSGADLTDADLRLADLDGATMVSTAAAYSHFDFARMPSTVDGSDFREASLVGTSGVWLTYVDLREATLDGSPLKYELGAGESQVLSQCVALEVDGEDDSATGPSEVEEGMDGEEELRQRPEGQPPEPSSDLRGALQRPRASEDHAHRALRRLQDLVASAGASGTLQGEAIRRRQGTLKDMLAEGRNRNVRPEVCLEELRGWTEDFSLSAGHVRLAKKIVATACQRPLIAEEVRRRALGELPPPAPSLRRALARELVWRHRSQERCPPLQEMPDLPERLCRDWPREDFCRWGDRVIMQAKAPGEP